MYLRKLYEKLLQIGVVNYLARQVIDVSFLNGLNRVCGLVDAFSNAIRGSHDDVTEYLLTLHPRRLFWGMKDACEAGVEMDNKDLVEKICALYRRDYRGESVFVKLAGFGSKNAVEFLYRNRHNDTELINKTFGKAARFGNTAVVEFLLDTGRDIFDKAMECAASSGYGKPATSISCTTRNSHLGKQAYVHSHKRAIYLWASCCLRTNIFRKVDLSRLSTAKRMLLEFLRRDPSLLSKTIDKAYIKVVTRSNSKSLKLLYGTKRVFPEAI
ncbi:Ankyrin repeat-containing domain [Phytophthora cactorum]|nr:Ankyrin repeat-containing domain [Phytophthora cactorum]